MLTWISEYLGTVVIALVLAAIIALILIKLVHDHKNGKSTCGSNCAHCAMASSCHKK